MEENEVPSEDERVRRKVNAEDEEVKERVWVMAGWKTPRRAEGVSLFGE